MPTEIEKYFQAIFLRKYGKSIGNIILFAAKCRHGHRHRHRHRHIITYRPNNTCHSQQQQQLLMTIIIIIISYAIIIGSCLLCLWLLFTW